jgi:hypothetical protein
MIEKQNITDEELFWVKLSCNWSDPFVRKAFAIKGLYLNVLIDDPNLRVSFTAAGRLIGIKNELARNKKHYDE